MGIVVTVTWIEHFFVNDVGGANKHKGQRHVTSWYPGINIKGENRKKAMFVIIMIRI